MRWGVYAEREENLMRHVQPKCHICGAEKAKFVDNWVENGIEKEEDYFLCPNSDTHDQRPQKVFDHFPERVLKIISLKFRYGEYECE